jgi:hypothetical protein
VGGIIITGYNGFFLFLPPTTETGDYEIRLTLADGEDAVGVIHHKKP